MPERCAEGGLPSPAPAAVRLCQEALFEGVSGKIQGMTEHRVYLWATHTDLGTEDNAHPLLPCARSHTPSPSGATQPHAGRVKGGAEGWSFSFCP